MLLAMKYEGGKKLVNAGLVSATSANPVIMGPGVVASPVLVAIKETLLAKGGMLGGTSAGTDCQTVNTMITNGNTYEALRDGTQMFWNMTELESDQLTAFGPGGLGLFPYGLLDTHFANRYVWHEAFIMISVKLPYEW